MNKHLIVAMLAVFAAVGGTVAHADTLLIERHSSTYSYAGSSFRFNEQQGTAWMEVHLTEDLGMGAPDMFPHGGPTIRHTTIAAPVAGLSFDAVASQIVFTGAAGKFVCATATLKSGVFGRKWLINLTGACRTFIMRGHGVETVYFEAK